MFIMICLLFSWYLLNWVLVKIRCVEVISFDFLTSIGRARKRKRRVDPMIDGFSTAVAKHGESLEKTASKLNRGAEREDVLDKKRSLLTSEISKMQFFIRSEKFKVTSMIRDDPEKVNMFWDLQEVDREEFAKWVLEE